MKKKFIKFLKQNDIDVDLFMYYTEPENNGFVFKKYDTIHEFFEKEPCMHWVEKAFNWNKSKFSLKKLIKINKKWKDICQNKKSILFSAIPRWIKKIKGD